jgi:hypothetical protein
MIKHRSAGLLPILEKNFFYGAAILSAKHEGPRSLKSRTLKV